MIELAWFVAGVAATLVAVRLLRPRKPAGRQRAQRPVAALPVVRPSNALRPAPVAADARRLALTLAEELATLVSGIEGRTHHLIEAAPNRSQLPSAAEALLRAVQRMRTLHSKLVAFGRARTTGGGCTDVLALVAGMRDELQHMQLGLELHWEPPTDLPPISGSADVVREALIFLCAALLRAERGATHLAIQAERCFASDVPRVQLELALEWVAEAKEPANDVFADLSFTLDLEAANNLITGLGGEVSVTHFPRRSIRAVVHWPAAAQRALAEAEPAPPPVAAPRRPEPVAKEPTPAVAHRYGGTLLLEADPLIRAMVASELKANGRAVFACADGASAKSFLEATPDRFELLIVDHHERLDADHALMAAIRRLAPDLKICLLTQEGRPELDSMPRVHCIRKPFGVHELRRALATVLAG